MDMATPQPPSCPPPRSSRPPGLIQRYREALQARHYAHRTVKTYEQWLRRFLYRELTVRDGKGNKDRRTMLPLGVGERMRVQLRKVKSLHEKDLAEGYGSVQLPGALRRKYRNADKQWNWQWVFPQHQRKKRFVAP
jgi:hypothetical protein